MPSQLALKEDSEIVLENTKIKDIMTMSYNGTDYYQLATQSESYLKHFLSNLPESTEIELYEDEKTYVFYLPNGDYIFVEYEDLR